MNFHFAYLSVVDSKNARFNKNKNFDEGSIYYKFSFRLTCVARRVYENVTSQRINIGNTIGAIVKSLLKFPIRVLTFQELFSNLS